MPAKTKTKSRTRPATRIVVVGAPAGGFEAMSELAAQLPEELPAVVFVVLHMAPTFAGSAHAREGPEHHGDEGGAGESLPASDRPQEPADAAFAPTPQSAIDHVEVDHCVKLASMEDRDGGGAARVRLEKEGVPRSRC